MENLLVSDSNIWKPKIPAMGANQRVRRLNPHATTVFCSHLQNATLYLFIQLTRDNVLARSGTVMAKA